MSTYRPVTDPIVKSRYCNTCLKPIVGIADRGLDYWLDITPLAPDLERIYHAVGRPTYTVRPRAGRTAWIDWRNPASSRLYPTTGIVLVQHAHQTPGPKADNPVWLVSDYRITQATTGGTACLF